MSKKSIAQTMKDAGFKPLSRAQQQQNIAILTPVWIEEQNDMTTKTDEARECAEEALIKYMVDRFLGWRLPETFRPDNGITFEPEFNKEYMASMGKPPMRHDPTGTNLFDAREAEAMVRYMLEGWHFPPSVPVSKLEEEVRRFDINWWFQEEDYNEDGEYVKWSDIEALIAEAK